MSCSLCMDGQANMTKLIVTFRSFVMCQKMGLRQAETQLGKATQCHSLAAMNCDVKVTYGRRSVIVTAFVVHHKETL